MEHKIVNFNYEEWLCSCGTTGYSNSDFEGHKKKMNSDDPIDPELR